MGTHLVYCLAGALCQAPLHLRDEVLEALRRGAEQLQLVLGVALLRLWRERGHRAGRALLRARQHRVRPCGGERGGGREEGKEEKGRYEKRRQRT